MMRPMLGHRRKQDADRLLALFLSVTKDTQKSLDKDIPIP
jgi:hypothetical protein